jgi:hypothetical protein
MSFEAVAEFESRVANFFGAKYAIATDSCTHAIELCLRDTQADFAESPIHTYLSIPMTLEKLGIDWQFKTDSWENFYFITHNIIDAAVLWEKDSYIPNTFMCVSFQFKKHLSLGRGGIILCDNKSAAERLKRMSYDGRDPNIPWSQQNINTLGYHYYMTPETAQQGLDKLDAAISKHPVIWNYTDYPDISLMPVFKNKR